MDLSGLYTVVDEFSNSDTLVDVYAETIEEDASLGDIASEQVYDATIQTQTPAPSHDASTQAPACCQDAST